MKKTACTVCGAEEMKETTFTWYKDDRGVFCLCEVVGHNQAIWREFPTRKAMMKFVGNARIFKV